MRFARLHPYDLIIVVLMLVLISRHLPGGGAMSEWTSANRHLVRGEFALAVEGYDAVLAKRPTFERAYFHRGVALFYLDRYSEAGTHFRRSLELGGDDYVLFWQYLASRRSGGGGEAELRAAIAERGLAANAWPGVLGALLLGEVKIRDAVKLIRRAPPKQQQGRLAEVLFYAGQRRLIDGDRPGALRFFQKAVETRATNYLEVTAAASELTRAAAGR